MFNAKYYSVICKCGHVGRKRSYTCVKFPIKAHSAYEAESIARNIPRVKHGSATAILKITEIDYSTFARILFENSLNPYLHCHSDEESEEKGQEEDTESEESLGYNNEFPDDGAPEHSAVIGSTCNLRAGAGYNYKVVTVLEQGTPITVIGEVSKGWYHISCEAGEGYIGTRFVDFG